MTSSRMLGILLLSAAACGSYRQKYDPDIAVAFNEAAGKSLKVETVWLKPRDDSIHLLLRFTNLYGEPVSVEGASVSLTFEGQPGRMRGSVDRHMLQSGETCKQLFIFVLGTKMETEGTVTVEVRPRTAGERVLPAATLRLPVKPWVGQSPG